MTKKRRGGPGILQEYFVQISETKIFLKNWFASFSMGHIEVDPSDFFGLMIS